MGTDFGQVLRRIRGDRSLREVASLAKCGKSYLCDLELGRRTPSAALAATLDSVLGAGGRLRALAPPSLINPVSRRLSAPPADLVGMYPAQAQSDWSPEEWEQAANRHGQSARRTAPTDLLPLLLGDFSALTQVLKYRSHSSADRPRLISVAARLAGLIAFTLFKTGDPASCDWSRTSRSAAAAAGDHHTLSWAYAQESVWWYFEGDMHTALHLTTRAQLVGADQPCSGAARAAGMEARIHAIQGRHSQAAEALSRAGTLFRHLNPAECVDSDFGFTEAKLSFHRGAVWTYLHDTSRARDAQHQALELYPSQERAERPMVQLDHALCLAYLGHTDDATNLVVTALSPLAPSHRHHLTTRMMRVLALRPPTDIRQRNLPDTRILSDAMKLLRYENDTASQVPSPLGLTNPGHKPSVV
ncbi:helix-turn-helix transcriptional regulator [Streptomyces olivoreticuli]